MPLGQQELRQLAAGRRLSRALEPAHHDDSGRRLDQINPRVHRPHQIDQLIVNDLHHELARLKAADHLLPQRLLLHAVGEVFDHLEVDIRFQQGRANVAHRLAHVLLTDPPPA
jgi:hypothetical protein